jgi:hypothetical protein
MTAIVQCKLFFNTTPCVNNMDPFNPIPNTALSLFTVSGLTPLNRYKSAAIWLSEENTNMIRGKNFVRGTLLSVTNMLPKL